MRLILKVRERWSVSVNTVARQLSVDLDTGRQRHAPLYPTYISVVKAYIAVTHHKRSGNRKWHEPKLDIVELHENRLK